MIVSCCKDLPGTQNDWTGRRKHLSAWEVQPLPADLLCVQCGVVSSLPRTDPSHIPGTSWNCSRISGAISGHVKAGPPGINTIIQQTSTKDQRMPLPPRSLVPADSTSMLPSLAMPAEAPMYVQDMLPLPSASSTSCSKPATLWPVHRASLALPRWLSSCLACWPTAPQACGQGPPQPLLLYP